MLLRPATLILLAAALAAAGCDRQSTPPEQAQAPAAAGASPDEVAPRAAAPAAAAGGVNRSHKGDAAPETAFRDPAGKSVTLANFRGAPVLVNLWATWCAPCIKEMPSLDAAAGAGGKVRVLAVSQDMDASKVAPFFAQRKLANLKPYVDPEMGLSLFYKANLPTTVMYDAAGKELWRVSGAFDWTGVEAKALLAEAS